MSEDKKGLSLEELANANRGNGMKEASITSISNSMIEKYGEPEKEIRYDDPVDEVIQKYGKSASDEVFEKAKTIVENKYAEMVINGELDDVEALEKRSTTQSIISHDVEENVQVDEYEPEVKYSFKEEIESLEKENIKKEPIIEPRRIEDSTDGNSISSMVEELQDDLSNDYDDEKYMEIVKTKVREKIKPITDKIDMSAFTISNDPISAITSFENAMIGDVTQVSDWVLYNTGVPFAMKEMTGYDIERLNPQNSRKNEYNTYRDIYSVIYSHIIADNKPELEEFLKLVKYADVRHLYFNIYRSSFAETNVLTYSCEKKGCNEIFVEDIDIDEMYRFVSKEVENNFNKIMQSSEGKFTQTQYESTVIQISDTHAVAVKEPSIYNVIFETASLDEAFKEKYGEILSLLSYIDKVFYIDRDSKSLIPIQATVYKDSLAKTVKYKTLQYGQVIETLNSDQYYNLTAAISNIVTNEDIDYFIPSRECPKCKSKTPEIKMSPESMLFTRHQLGALANI